ncbi:hypothetical protein RKD23_000897 [Streptomyces sp. SAI-170]|uniref:hypothetical protein n=1 Tax=Streptomyces sp. SAI-170 TaxID=3377729 RepID=UPI003C79880F
MIRRTGPAGPADGRRSGARRRRKPCQAARALLLAGGPHTATGEAALTGLGLGYGFRVGQA